MNRKEWKQNCKKLSKNKIKRLKAKLTMGQSLNRRNPSDVKTRAETKRVEK